MLMLKYSGRNSRRSFQSEASVRRIRSPMWQHSSTFSASCSVQSAQSKYDQLYVILSELYFGFGDDEHIITAIPA
jgi:hypothetical protein